MKEFFPSPKAVASYIDTSLTNGSWSVANMPPAEKVEKINSANEPQEVQFKQSEDQTAPNVLELSPQLIVVQAEQVIANYQSQSLHDIAADANVELPAFSRLFIMRYTTPEEQLRSSGNTWYGITNDHRLSRYQYIPSTNTLTVCENTSSTRLQEILMTVTLKKERASMSSHYDKNAKDQTAQLLARGFSITEDEAQSLIEHMPLEEKMKSYRVKQTQLQW